MTSHNQNPEPCERKIVKLTRVTGGLQYVVCGERRAGIQYRQRHGLPADLLGALDRDGRAYAWASLSRSGRWHLHGVAPAQSW